MNPINQQTYQTGLLTIVNAMLDFIDSSEGEKAREQFGNQAFASMFATFDFKGVRGMGNTTFAIGLSNWIDKRVLVVRPYSDSEFMDYSRFMHTHRSLPPFDVLVLDACGSNTSAEMRDKIVAEWGTSITGKLLIVIR